jgi:hypothetical protein
MSIRSAAGTGGFLIGRSFPSDDLNSFFIYDLASSQNRFYIDTTPNIFQYATAFGWGNAANSTEYMRLTSTGLGIGTSSPGAKLHVVGGQLLQTASDGAKLFIGHTIGNTSYAAIGGTLTNGLGTTAGNLEFFTGNIVALVKHMTLDSSGNLLVGLTSATGVAKLQVSGPLRTTGYTVATLPAGTVGMRTYVTDALAPSFGVTVAGSGAVTIPVFYDGANWIVA